jgi:hypothetical protein
MALPGSSISPQQAASEHLAVELKDVLSDFMDSLGTQLNQAYSKVLGDMGGEIDELRRRQNVSGADTQVFPQAAQAAGNQIPGTHGFATMPGGNQMQGTHGFATMPGAASPMSMTHGLPDNASPEFYDDRLYNDIPVRPPSAYTRPHSAFPLGHTPIMTPMYAQHPSPADLHPRVANLGGLTMTMTYEDIRKEMKRELRRELWQLREGILKDLPGAVADHLDRNVSTAQYSSSPGPRSHSFTRRSPSAHRMPQPPDPPDNVMKRLCVDVQGLREEVRSVYQVIETIGERFQSVEGISEHLHGINAIGERLQGVEDLGELIKETHAQCAALRHSSAECVWPVPPEPFSPVFPLNLPNTVSVAGKGEIHFEMERGGGCESSALLSQSDKADSAVHDFDKPVRKRRASQLLNLSHSPDPHGAGARSSSNNTVDAEETEDADDEDDTEANEKLEAVLLMSEEITARELQLARTPMTDRIKDFFVNMERVRFEMCMEIVIGSVISLNAFFIGVEMNYDREKYPGWHGHTLFKSVNLIVCIVFTLEIVIKLYLHGFIEHFCGPEPKMNILDAVIVLADIIQLSEFLAIPLPPALFRLVRLVRLVRLLRVVRSAVFADLLSMVQGIIGAMVTLVWALVLLLFMVYFFALLFFTLYESESPIGGEDVEHVTYYFENVPRAFLTTFRCAFGDCSTAGGTPIFEMIYNHEKSRLLIIVFCMFGFFFWVGLFNVIAAIFVESTMAAANKLTAQKFTQRLNDKELWAKNVGVLIQILWEKDNPPCADLSEHIEDVASLDLPCKDVQEAALTPEACQALLNLDICQEDHAHLADILDPDNGGSIGVLDMMDGLARLRGEPRRSDIVTIDLMVRALQQSMGDLHKDVKKIGRDVGKVKKGAARGESKL